MSALPSNPPGAIMDLERELSCSICTDLLYQPLTCIPCLHTFCGSCLKEWFGWQAVRHNQQHARDGTERRHRPDFTCPSCRAVVRETRPNATVTTLLDMYTAANPEKGKSAAEKQEIDRNYKHGDTVLPAEDNEQSVSETDSTDDAEDQQLLDEVRALSLRDANITSVDSTGRDFQARARARHEHRERRPHPRRREQSTGHARTSQAQLSIPPADRQRSSSRRRQEAERRQLEHQSSLRSLLSNSDVESEEMQAEILRQITEEGLLDGIDLDNIRVEQEDEISERIAQAYRRRQRELAIQRESHRRTHRRTESAADNVAPRARPTRPRGVSQSEVQTTDVELDSHSRRETDAAHTGRPPHAQTDLGTAARNRSAVRASRESRRSTDPARRAISEQWRQGAAGISPQPPALSILPDDHSHSSSNLVPSAGSRDGALQPSSSTVPTVTCDRCGIQHIEFELHYNCSRCSSMTTSTYDLCRRCFLLGKGCRHWFGFGYAAEARFQKSAPTGGWPSGTDPPHILQARRYVKRNDREHSRTQKSTVLQSGMFCDNCLQDSNDCYWRCDQCNEGEWGFCNTCVGQARHCTHPLLALTMTAGGNEASQFLVTLQSTTSCNICSQAIEVSQSRYHCPSCNDGDFDICHSCYSSLVATGRIASADGPQGRRLCPSGHRMLVAACEQDTMGYNRRVVAEPVVGGWAHRSEALNGVTTSVHGQRLVNSDGWAWDERDESGSMNRRTVSPTSESGSERLANGGLGTRMIALWTRVPAEQAKDELTFPRLAEITEVIDINGDWCSGVYCRRLGLFPGPFARSKP